MAARHRYKMRYTGVQHRPASSQVNAPRPRIRHPHAARHALNWSSGASWRWMGLRPERRFGWCTTSSRTASVLLDDEGRRSGAEGWERRRPHHDW
jgi:hypothetical protein